MLRKRHRLKNNLVLSDWIIPLLIPIMIALTLLIPQDYSSYSFFSAHYNLELGGTILFVVIVIDKFINRKPLYFTISWLDIFVSIFTAYVILNYIFSPLKKYETNDILPYIVSWVIYLAIRNKLSGLIKKKLYFYTFLIGITLIVCWQFTLSFLQYL